MKRGLWVISAVSVAAMVVLAVASTRSPAHAAAAYLVGWFSVLAVVLGIHVIVLVAHSISVRWIVVVRRLAENVTATLPWLAVTFVPVLLLAPHIYPWAKTPAEVPAHLATWLSRPFVAARALVYFTTWIAVSEIVRRRANSVPPRDTRAVAAAGLPLYAITVTVASFDWLVSLTPNWFSTMYGVYIFATGFCSAWALLTLIVWAADRGGDLANRVSQSHYHAIGRMLFAFVIFWTYIAFGQAFLIYMADLPNEVVWSIARLTPPWNVLTMVLVVARFVVPFFILLPKSVKRRRDLLAAVSVLVLMSGWLDIAFLVLPSTGMALGWLDVVALIALGGTTLGFGLWRGRGSPVMPEHDRLLAASLRYVSQ